MKNKPCRSSAPDILSYSLAKNLFKAERIINKLNSIRVWPKKRGNFCSTCLRVSMILQNFGRNLTKHVFFEYFMTLCVILNIVVLAFDSHQNFASNDFWSICNLIFTCLFALEMLLKLSSFGFRRYTKDSLNNIDATIILMSSVELIALGT